MKKILFPCIFLFAFKTNMLPVGWVQIEKTTIRGEELEVYFFDYTSKLNEVEPGFEKYKEREFTNALKKVQFLFPAYAAKRNVINEDSIIYYVLRPNKDKADKPHYFDLEIFKVHKDFSLQSLEDRSLYQDRIRKTTDATGCRGGLISEYMFLIQDNPDKNKLIGNAFRLTDSIFTRVIPYSEVKKPFYKVIETNF